MWQDWRFAFRSILNNKKFSSIAILTLTLGIGANTAIFSLIDRVVLRPLPYEQPHELVRLWQRLAAVGEGRLGVSPAEYLDYQRRTHAFSSIAGYELQDFDLTAYGEPERIEAARVTGSLFPLLGVSPFMGQVFSGSPTDANAPKVAVLNYSYWKRRYGGDPAVLGRSIRLDEEPYTIIGIMPPDFEFPATSASVGEPPVLWTPLTFSGQQIAQRAASFDVNVIARLKPGTTLAQAAADAELVAAQFQRENPAIYSGNIHLRNSLEPWGPDIGPRVRTALFTLSAAVGVILLIACANVASLLLAQNAARRHDLALRTALGATSRQIFLQLLTEAAVLAVLAGAAGCLLGGWILRAVSGVWAAQLSLRGLALDSRILVFTLLLSAATAILCGVIPAWRVGAGNLTDALKQSGRQSASSRDRSRLRNLLVVFEAAGALVLTVAAGLLVHSFIAVLNVPPGFDPAGALIVRTSFNRQRYGNADRRRATERLMQERLTELPGIEAVGLTTHVPLADDRQIGFTVEGTRQDETHWAANALVSGTYFHAMRIRLLSGRTFSDADTPNASRFAAIVNETLANRYWPGESPIGKRLRWGGRRLVVIGLVSDVHIKALDAAVEPTIYTSLFQVESGATANAVFVLRSRQDQPERYGAQAKAAIWSVDRALPVFGIEPLSEVVENSLATRRITVILLGSFSILALALTVAGLYGLLSYTVEQRTREIGVRLAVGARPMEILRLVVGEGSALTGAGILLGLVLSFLAASATSKLLFGISAFDPAAFTGGAATIFVTSLLASSVPAWRASRTDPIQALRTE